MNNITIGSYYAGDSWIYRLDPRMKLIITIALMIFIFLIPTIYGMLIALGVFLVIFFSTKIPFLRFIKGLKPIIFLLVFTFVLQIVYNSSGKMLVSISFQFGLWQILGIVGLLLLYFFTKKFIPFSLLYFLLIVALAFALQHYFVVDKFVIANYHVDIYEGGLLNSAFVFTRIVLMLGITSLLTLSTSSMDINNGFAAILSPLKLIHFPVGVVSMTLSLTLRFIPTLLEETNKIMKAQASRGVDFNEGRLKDKVLQIVSLLIPMFVISIKRAEDLANAMEARGYIVEGKRTKYDCLKLKFRDYFCFGCVVIFYGVLIGARIWLG